jgi:hypothetical protein
MSKLGRNHHNWKGKNAVKISIHEWVIRRRGRPKYCEHCHKTDKKKYEWANKNHLYKRILKQYIRLCTSCHRKYDYEFNNRVKRKPNCGWSDKNSECINCGTILRIHAGNGLCTKCYEEKRKEYKKLWWLKKCSLTQST